MAWLKEQFAPQVREFREWLARPLEAIDRFVESLR